MKLNKFFVCLIFLGLLVGSVALFSSSSTLNNVSSEDEKNITTMASASYLQMNEEELFGFADIVALGKVKKVSEPKEMKYSMDSEVKSIIYKDYLFEIKESFKGASPSSEVIIRVPGGQIGKKIYISDVPVPDLEKEQILFLTRYLRHYSSDVTYSILGGQQGKYTINGSTIKNIDKQKDLTTFEKELKVYKGKYGDKIIPPPGVNLNP